MVGTRVALQRTVEPTDLALAQRAAAGDRAARDQLVSKHYGSVARLCQRVCRDPSRIDDVVQETFVALLRDLPRYRGDAAFTTWAFTIARTHHGRAVRSDIRHRARAERLGIHLASIPPTVPPLEDPLLRRRVLDAMSLLSDLDRAVLEGRDIRGESARETANALGLSIPAVKTRLHRARARMRQLLGPVRSNPHAA